MEYFQKRYLQEGLTFVGNTGLMTIDLPNKGLLSCIEFRVKSTTGVMTFECNNWIHDAIEKVELIVNGSQVVKSLTGEQILALNYYDGTAVDLTKFYNVTSGAQRENFFINLGRWFHDMEYMLDLGRVTDPELRITYDFTKTTAAQLHGWGNGFAFAGPHQIWIIPHILRESAVAPLGYIKTSECHRFTSKGSLKYNMTIPRGPLYCGLYLQSWYYEEGLGGNIEHIELNLDNDRLIPFRMDEMEFFADIYRKYGEFKRCECLSVKTGEYYPAPFEVGKWSEHIIAGYAITGGMGMLWNNVIGWTGTVMNTALAAAAGVFLYREPIWEGFLPYSVAKIPHFDLKRPETWINSAELGDFWLRVEEPSTAGTNVAIKLLADEVVTRYL